MSKARMEQSWQRIKAQIQAVWGDMDDAELKKARGNLSKMVSIIHEKTGEDPSVIMRKISTVV